MMLERPLSHYWTSPLSSTNALPFTLRSTCYRRDQAGNNHVDTHGDYVYQQIDQVTLF